MKPLFFSPIVFATNDYRARGLDVLAAGPVQLVLCGYNGRFISAIEISLDGRKITRIAGKSRTTEDLALLGLAEVCVGDDVRARDANGCLAVFRSLHLKVVFR